MADTSPTPRQLEVMRLISTSRKTNGYPPTIRELVDALAVKSTNAVVCHLSALSKKGLVQWSPGKGRTLTVTAAGRAWVAALALVLFAGCAPRPAPVVCIAPPAPSCAPAWNQADLAAALLADCRGALLACQSRGGGR
jgi:SOS-response transcriptional repressor LexA